MPVASVYSIYLNNIPASLRETQKECVMKFLPEGWEFKQLWSRVSHPDGLADAVEQSKNDIIIFLDIDCVPLSDEALPFLAEGAEQGLLVGAVQRANHVNNNAHLYVGPFSMGFSREKYYQLGCPTFTETYRGDVAEELTYRWQEDNPRSIMFLWPSHVEQPLWDLDGSYNFGLGTTYGQDSLFYHLFNARDPLTQQKFIIKCNQVLEKQVA